jgi:WD40 repeat protein
MLAGLFYRDDRHLLGVGPFGFVRVFDVQTRKELVGRPGHRLDVTDVTFSADGRTLVSLGHDGALRTWDTRTGREAACLFAGGSIAANSLSLSADGKRASLLATGEESRWDVVLVDLPRRQVSWRLPGLGQARGFHQPAVVSPSTVLSADGSAVVVLRDDPLLKRGAMRLDVLETAGALAQAVERPRGGNWPCPGTAGRWRWRGRTWPSAGWS